MFFTFGSVDNLRIMLRAHFAWFILIVRTMLLFVPITSPPAHVFLESSIRSMVRREAEKARRAEEEAEALRSRFTKVVISIEKPNAIASEFHCYGASPYRSHEPLRSCNGRSQVIISPFHRTK